MLPLIILKFWLAAVGVRLHELGSHKCCHAVELAQSLVFQQVNMLLFVFMISLVHVKITDIFLIWGWVGGSVMLL